MRQESFRILFLMRKGRTKKDGFATIYARITTGSFRQEIYFNCEGRPELWNQRKERMMGTSRLSLKINEMLDEFRVQILDIRSKLKRFKEIRENPHFNALQVKFAYAVTCHKAQGGQWKAVFVDRCIFGDEPMTRDMLRWLYTALTRATDKLYLVNFDERFYE